MDSASHTDRPRSNAELSSNGARAMQTGSTERGIYRSIVQSTAVLGAMRFLTVFLNFARNKVLAITIGPEGVGLFGLFDSLANSAVIVSSLGVNASGVREIAIAKAKGRGDELSDVHETVRRLSKLLSLAGGVLVAIFCVPLARYTFGDDAYAIPVAVIGVAVLFTGITAGYRAQLQGMQRIKDLGRLGAYAAITDAVIVIIATLALGRSGIALGLAVSALVTCAIFWSAARQENRGAGRTLGWKPFLLRSRQLVGLGISIAAALFFAAFAAYIIRAFITRELGLAEAGLYGAVFMLSGKSIGFLLDSMRLDFYPKLSAASDDNHRLNLLMNGQTEICLLLTIPGILITIAFSPYLLRLFYSAEFVIAAPLLSLFTLGSLARVLTNPLGYVRLAKGKSLLYLLSGAGSALGQVGLTYVFMKWLGLFGAVLGYVVHAICHSLILWISAYCLTGFRWSSQCGRLVVFLVPVTVLFSISTYFVAPLTAAIAGGVLSFAIGMFNIRELYIRLGPEHRIFKFLQRVPFGSMLFPQR